MDLPFNEGLIEDLADKRISFLTTIFLIFTFIGATEGYIIIVAGIYWLKDKKIAYRVTLLTLLSSTCNHILKIIIKHPRPFVVEDTYKDNWAISESDMDKTALEYSTPSGHAMGSATFWSYLFRKFKSRNMLIFSVFMILMIGFSRPYLGVHYFEDILLGWMLGLLLTFIILKYENNIINLWNSISKNNQMLLVISVSILIWILAGLLLQPAWGFNAQPFATYGGFGTGLVIGYIIEEDKLKYNPQINSIPNAVIRYMLGIILVFITMIGLDEIFAVISGDDSFLGFLLRYIRYFLVAFVTVYVAPYVFIKVKLVDIGK